VAKAAPTRVGSTVRYATLALLLQVTLFCLAKTYDIPKLNVAWMQKLYDSHREMVDALVARNEGLAVRKILRYLEMVKGWWLERSDVHFVT